MEFAARASDALSRVLGGLDAVDESLVDYLASAVSSAAADDDNDVSTAVSSIVPQFLVSCGVVDSEEAAGPLCAEIVRALEGAGVGKVEPKEATKAENGGKRRRRRRRRQNNNDDGDGDDWGISTLKNQNKANKEVDSFLSEKAQKQRAKKEAREKRKEDAANRRLDEQHKAAASASGTIVQSEATKDGTNSSGDVLVHNFSLSVGTGKELLSNATVKLARGRRYGLIGRNGVGKSTLF